MSPTYCLGSMKAAEAELLVFRRWGGVPPTDAGVHAFVENICLWSAADEREDEKNLAMYSGARPESGRRCLSLCRDLGRPGDRGRSGRRDGAVHIFGGETAAMIGSEHPWCLVAGWFHLILGFAIQLIVEIRE